MNTSQNPSDDLLKMAVDNIRMECVERYELCNKQLQKKCDLNGIIVFNHGMENNRTNLSLYINKVGGRIKLAVDDTVNLVVIEMSKLSKMVSDFESWRVAALSKVQLDTSTSSTYDR